ncbi:hypothetical protein RHIZ_23350 [Rhizobium skierniewicense]|nr:hypothetical protein [Rhizobium skierniewicense]
MRHLVHSGDVALNSVVNGRILQEGHARYAGSGDSGTSIGGAVFVYKQVLKQPGKIHHADPFIADAYSNQEIEELLKTGKDWLCHSSDVCAEAARALHKEDVIGLFQGKMALGPLPLGGRSILVDPTKAGVKDKINAEVKHR